MEKDKHLIINAKYDDFQNGDLLFVSISNDDLCAAINDVTQITDEINYSHVGILEIENNEQWVLHASNENGTERISLEEFRKAMQKDHAGIFLHRIKKKYKVDFEKAIIRAKGMLGKPYNFSFLLTDKAHYCSEFVYQAFLEDFVFEMEPMTFKINENGEFHPTWQEYYNKLTVEIPEGELGCNPNGLAASQKLEKIKML